MVDIELERNKKDRISGWEGIEKGPIESEVTEEQDESSISKEDVEYFKNNPKELSDLVADLVKLRGGADAIKEGATWNKEMRAYVGEDGLPRDWAHLTGYLKRNPDAIGSVLEEYYSLTSSGEDEAEVAAPSGESIDEIAVDSMAEEDAAAAVAPGGESIEKIDIDAAAEDVTEADVAAGGGIEAAPVIEVKQKAEVFEKASDTIKSTEKISKRAEEGAKIINFEQAKSNKDKKETEPKKLSIDEAATKIDELDGEVDAIRDYGRQSAVWESMAKVLDGCSDGVKAQVKYMRAEESLKRSQEFLNERKARLKKMPLITFPWSKKRQEKKMLRDLIASSSSSLEYQQRQLDGLAKDLPESISDEDKSLIDKFRNLDARMDRSNSDLHVRGLTKDIKMRENWIRDQENILNRPKTDAKVINDPGEKARTDAIEKWKAEIADLQSRISEYQKEHPDFELNPGDKKPKSETLDKAA